jgi:hypothetical protein
MALKLQTWLRAKSRNEDFLWHMKQLYISEKQSSAMPLQKHQNRHKNVWNTQWKKVI